MPNLLEGKLALILGIANKWSLAYAIAQAFWREGATLALTYLGDRQKVAIEELSQGLPVAGLWPCDVTKDDDLRNLAESLKALGRPLDAAAGVQAGTVLCGGQQRCMPHLAAIFFPQPMRRSTIRVYGWCCVCLRPAISLSFPNISKCLSLPGTFTSMQNRE